MEKPDLLHGEINMLKEAYLSDRKIFFFMFPFQGEFFSLEQFASRAQSNDGQISNSGCECRWLRKICLLLMIAP